MQVGEDAFSVGMFELVFERGKKGDATGFLLDAGRASNIVFSKR